MSAVSVSFAAVTNERSVGGLKYKFVIFEF